MWWPKIRLAGLLWLLPGLALAQAAGPSPRDEALQYYQASEQLYAKGDYAGALSYLEEAYRLQPSPTLLYNMARAREKLDRLPEALATYEAYLSESPNADNREQVQLRISTLRKEIDERERLRREREAAAGGATAGVGATGASTGWGAVGDAPSGGAEPSDEGEEGGGAGPWPWIVAGAGVASLVTAGALFAMAGARHDEAANAKSQLDAYDLQSSAESLATGSTVATVAGVVLLGVGGLWGVMSLVGGSDDDEEDAAFVPLLGPGAAGIRGRF